MYSNIFIKIFLLSNLFFVFLQPVYSGINYKSGFAVDSLDINQSVFVDTLINDVPAILDFTDQIPDNDTIVKDTVIKKENGNILRSKVDYKANDTVRFDLANQKVYLFGQADIKYEDIHLVADYIEIDFVTNQIFATGLADTAGVIQGKPVFTEKGQSYRSDELTYNFDTEKGRTINVITEEADGYLHGSIVKIMDDESIHVGSGKYTTCDKDDPHFYIGFRRAKVMENKIITGPAFFYLYDIPTPVVIPFGFFPNTNKQASGILVPSYGESSNQGFYLRDGGFYWGINDYIDMSFKGDIYSRGSWGLSNESRYFVRYRFRGNLNLSYGVRIFGEEGLPGYSRMNDFWVRWNHSEDPRARPNSSFQANVNAGSSKQKRYNPAVSAEDYLSNTFSSNISYRANSRDGRYNFGANLRHTQHTDTERINLTLPHMTFSVSRFFPFRNDNRTGTSRWYEDISMSYNMEARNEINTTDSLFLKSETWQNMKNGIQHRIPISHSFNLLNHFNVSSSINYTERWYFQTIEKSWEQHIYEKSLIESKGLNLSGDVITDTVRGMSAARDFVLSTGVGTNIYGLKNFKRGPVTAVRHVARPNVGFSYRPDFGSDFWGYYDSYYDPNRNEYFYYSHYEDGIYGSPPTGKSGSLNFSLSNNLEIKTRSRDEEKPDRKISLIDNLSVSTSYDFARDSLNLSDVVLSGRTRILERFDISFGATWTPYMYDENNRKINRFVWEETDKLLQLTNTSWRLNFDYSFSGGSKNGRNGNGQGDNMIMDNGDMQSDRDFFNTNGMDAGWDEPEEVIQPEPLPDGVIDYSVPWNLRFSYSFSYTTRVDQVTYDVDRNYIQTLTFNGDIRLTPKWRIGFRSGFDFENRDITYTSFNLYRDLHCWEMTFNWVPFGFRQSYNFTIRVKSQVLKDLKYDQRRDFYDFY